MIYVGIIFNQEDIGGCSNCLKQWYHNSKANISMISSSKSHKKNMTSRFIDSIISHCTMHATSMPSSKKSKFHVMKVWERDPQRVSSGMALK